MAKTTFGSRLKALRLARGIHTPEELAERSGVHFGVIRKLENGQNAWPRVDTALALARGLGVPVAKLLEGLA